MEIDVTTIIEGYARGYFLMAEAEGDSLGWYYSSRRAIIPLDDRFRYPKSLRRAINQNRFSIAINRDFESVVEGCANRDVTWISPELKEIYRALYHTGWAYSFEAWYENELAGGILGIVIGAAFIGESMFFRVPEASKVAMVKLVELLRSRQFMLFDAQMNNPHLQRFGAYVISEKDYITLLDEAVKRRCYLI